MSRPTRASLYVIGADPAEGNPQSDESAAVVLDTDTNERSPARPALDPELFAARLVQLARLYGGGPILVERNNHGHAVLQALRSSGWVVYGRDHAAGLADDGREQGEGVRAHGGRAARPGAR